MATMSAYSNRAGLSFLDLLMFFKQGANRRQSSGRRSGSLASLLIGDAAVGAASPDAPPLSVKCSRAGTVRLKASCLALNIPELELSRRGRRITKINPIVFWS